MSCYPPKMIYMNTNRVNIYKVLRLSVFFACLIAATSQASKPSRSDNAIIHKIYTKNIIPKLLQMSTAVKIQLLGRNVPFKKHWDNCGGYTVYSILQNEVPLRIWELDSAGKENSLETSGYFEGSAGTPIWVIQVLLDEPTKYKISEFFGYGVHELYRNPLGCLEIDIYEHSTRCSENDNSDICKITYKLK